MIKLYAIAKLIFLLIEYFIAGLRVILFDEYIVTSLSWSCKKIKKKTKAIKSSKIIDYYENLLRK